MLKRIETWRGLESCKVPEEALSEDRQCWLMSCRGLSRVDCEPSLEMCCSTVHTYVPLPVRTSGCHLEQERGSWLAGRNTRNSHIAIVSIRERNTRCTEENGAKSSPTFRTDARLHAVGIIGTTTTYQQTIMPTNYNAQYERSDYD